MGLNVVHSTGNNVGAVRKIDSGEALGLITEYQITRVETPLLYLYTYAMTECPKNKSPSEHYTSTVMCSSTCNGSLITWNGSFYAPLGKEKEAEAFSNTLYKMFSEGVTKLAN